MKMTDVITGLRELNPGLQEESLKLEITLGNLSSSAEDAAACKTDRGRAILVADLKALAYQAVAQYSKVMQKVREVDALTKSYTRTLAVEAGNKPGSDKGDEGAPMLPGFEPEAGNNKEGE